MLQVTFLPPSPVHPHIYSNGHICLDILYDGQSGGWSPALTMNKVGAGHSRPLVCPVGCCRQHHPVRSRLQLPPAGPVAVCRAGVCLHAFTTGSSALSTGAGLAQQSYTPCGSSQAGSRPVCLQGQHAAQVLGKAVPCLQVALSLRSMLSSNSDKVSQDQPPVKHPHTLVKHICHFSSRSVPVQG